MSMHTPPNGRTHPWIAHRTSQQVASLIEDAWPLGLHMFSGPEGETVIDCGQSASGTWEAGRRIVELAHGGMASATLGITDVGGIVLPSITVESWRPSDSAFRLQVSVPLEEVDPAIRVSGPILARQHPDTGQAAHDVEHGSIAIVETERWDEQIAIALARRFGGHRSDLTLILVPSSGVVGATQLAGRVNECVIFTLQESLGVDASAVVHLIGDAPIAPPSERPGSILPDDLIHYAGRAAVTVDVDRDDLAFLAEQLTFASTSHYGKRFADLLADGGGVFEAIPGVVDLNKIAEISLIHLRTGKTFSAGARDGRMLRDWMRASRCERDVNP